MWAKGPLAVADWVLQRSEDMKSGISAVGRGKKGKGSVRLKPTIAEENEIAQLVRPTTTKEGGENNPPQQKGGTLEKSAEEEYWEAEDKKKA